MSLRYKFIIFHLYLQKIVAPIHRLLCIEDMNEYLKLQTIEILRRIRQCHNSQLLLIVSLGIVNRACEKRNNVPQCKTTV